MRDGIVVPKYLSMNYVLFSKRKEEIQRLSESGGDCGLQEKTCCLGTGSYLISLVVETMDTAFSRLIKFQRKPEINFLKI